MEQQNQNRHTDDYIFGIRAIIEAIRFGKQVDKILMKIGQNNELTQELTELIRQNNIPVQRVPVERLDRITRKNHQGVIALMSPVAFCQVENIVAQAFENGKMPFIVALDGVTDVRNFGAIVRSAECAGVDAIVVPEKGASRIGPDAVKTSAGALHKVPICRTSSLKKTLQMLMDSGLTICGATEKTDNLYYNQTLTGPLCLVMGAEDTGLNDEVMRICEPLLKIPILGSIESLNVSAAAAVLMFEVVRQRDAK
ncbi:MAG: 23S rRNA (guanosine(2251)-2'-O)-methyltransferase RlmB [Salinivirgaceae bacterium]|nr:23S rRNA (guanosine(2251)-2'-O)-methyltransferase RlmB [Salinivirgaceae bacterium]